MAAKDDGGQSKDDGEQGDTLGPVLGVAPSDDADPLQHGVQQARVFQVACVPRMDQMQMNTVGFSASTQTEITSVLEGYLNAVSAAMPAKSRFTPRILWNLTTATVNVLQPFDVVLYFVMNVQRSRAVKLGIASIQNEYGGMTTRTPDQRVICEVFVEGNFPATFLANIGFHELMHAKLDIMGKPLRDMHASGGGGLANPQTTPNSQLSDINKRLLVANLFNKVPMWTDGI